jgi:hypothetical protein
MPRERNLVPLIMNNNGGYYQPGRRYDFRTKMEVATVFADLWQASFPSVPHISQVAKVAKVGWKYAAKVVDEITITGDLIDPDIQKVQQNVARQRGEFLSQEEEVFLLSLRAEDATRPLLDYVQKLDENYGTRISVGYLCNWFKTRWQFRGSLRKASLIPYDKFKPENIARFIEYRHWLDVLFDHTRYNFLDEKHIVNSDAAPNRVRADPLTGYIDNIPVSGDFRDAYNLMAVITGNPAKTHPIVYSIGRDNGDATAFLVFVTSLIDARFFEHNEVLVMDNATIHTGGDADIVEDLLWTSVVDGMPLHVVILYLPTRSPELNPIELIFHILARRIRSFRYRMSGPCEHAVLVQATRVMDDMSHELMASCYGHCGY